MKHRTKGPVGYRRINPNVHVLDVLCPEGPNLASFRNTSNRFWDIEKSWKKNVAASMAAIMLFIIHSDNISWLTFTLWAQIFIRFALGATVSEILMWRMSNREVQVFIVVGGISFPPVTYLGSSRRLSSSWWRKLTRVLNDGNMVTLVSLLDTRLEQTADCWLAHFLLWKRTGDNAMSCPRFG